MQKIQPDSTTLNVCLCVSVCVRVCVHVSTCVWCVPSPSLLSRCVFDFTYFLSTPISHQHSADLMLFMYIIFYVMYVALCATSVEADVHNLRVTILMKNCLFFGGGTEFDFFPNRSGKCCSALKPCQQKSPKCSLQHPGKGTGWMLESSINGTWDPRVSDESKLGREFGMKTPSILANSSVLRDIVSKTRRSMSWYRMNGTHWIEGGSKSHTARRERDYISRAWT